MHYLMATSFVVLVMISFKSSSCQASWTSPPCFPSTSLDCTKEICISVCAAHGHETNHPYCRKGLYQWPACCCPPPALTASVNG
ncbi:unnamed protein product [Urochloa decumbens]|uniref:Uncharacterized protein n=1 Tax=Urochloa decumbens TaxID=240449 RepID=A0ABC9ATT3_9POAL